MSTEYDAVLVVGFGGPEKREDVIPFLENVLRGRNVPRERMLEVAEHYYHFDGVSPINQQTRDVIDALKQQFAEHGPDVPIYWGNRNWHPMLADTLQEMVDQNKRKILALVMAGYSSYSSCRQYREDIYKALDTVQGDRPDVDKVRVFYNHPDFIDANVENVESAISGLSEDQRSQLHLVFTAHSIPMSMADNCAYETQLTETCRLISERVGIPEERSRLVYQSRSGRPQDPWLEPDICDFLKALGEKGVKHSAVLPVGFLSDHMEVMFDLDEEAQEVCEEIGMQMIRVPTVGTHPKFIGMLRELVLERMDDSQEKRAVGNYPPNHDVCPIDCCPAPMRPGRPR